MASSDKQQGKGKSPEEIGAGFNELRNQQRGIVSKISELEIELKEHVLVTETLKGVDNERRCFRLIGGVLVERKVKDIMPALEDNQTKLSDIVKMLKQQLEKKGVELQAYAAEYKIRLRGEDEGKSQQQQEQKQKPSGGVLVA